LAISRGRQPDLPARAGSDRLEPARRGAGREKLVGFSASPGTQRAEVRPVAGTARSALKEAAQAGLCGPRQSCPQQNAPRQGVAGARDPRRGKTLAEALEGWRFRPLLVDDRPHGAHRADRVVHRRSTFEFDRAPIRNEVARLRDVFQASRAAGRLSVFGPRFRQLPAEARGSGRGIEALPFTSQAPRQASTVHGPIVAEPWAGSVVNSPDDFLEQILERHHGPRCRRNSLTNGRRAGGWFALETAPAGASATKCPRGTK